MLWNGRTRLTHINQVKRVGTKELKQNAKQEKSKAKKLRKVQKKIDVKPTLGKMSEEGRLIEKSLLRAAKFPLRNEKQVILRSRTVYSKIAGCIGK